MKKTGLMIRAAFWLIVISPVFCFNNACGSPDLSSGDTLSENQILFNGRLWRNLYTHVLGDQFLLEPDFVQSTVFIEGRTFNGVPLKYDILKDELISRTNRSIFIQLNKEHIDSFLMNFSGKTWRFINKGDTAEMQGYIRILYDGKNKFYIKYRKNIDLLAVDRKYDSFYQIRKMYLVRNGVYHSFNGRMELFRLFGDYRKDVKAYIRKNRIRILREDPESFIPVISYYDRIRQ